MKKKTNSNPIQPPTAPAPSTNDCPFSPAPDEPPEAFQAFRSYFEMKGKRSTSILAQEAGVSPRTIRRWAKSFDWEGRLNQYRASLLKESAQPQAEQQRDESFSWVERGDELRELEWEISRDLFRAIQRRLQSDVLDQATLADLARSFTCASRIGRLAAGLPNTPPDEAQPTEDPRHTQFMQALELAVRSYQAQQDAAAAAGGQPPSPPQP